MSNEYPCDKCIKNKATILGELCNNCISAVLRRKNLLSGLDITLGPIQDIKPDLTLTIFHENGKMITETEYLIKKLENGENII